MDGVHEETVTRTYEEYPEFGIRVNTVVRKRGGGTTMDRDVDIDMNFNREDFGDDLDCVAAAKAFIDHPTYKKLCEIFPGQHNDDQIQAGLVQMWKLYREREIEATARAEAEALDAAMTEQEEQMIALCPDGNYHEYTAFLDHKGMRYVFVRPGYYVSMRTPPS